MPGVSLRKKDGTWTLKQSWREAIKLNMDKKIIQKEGCNHTLVAQCEYKQAGEPDQEEDSESPTSKMMGISLIKANRLACDSESE